MAKKQSFIFYETIEELLLELPDEEYIEISKAVMKYGLHDIDPGFTGIKKALWTQIKFCIDNSKEFRAKQSEKASKRWNKTESYQVIPTSAKQSQSIPSYTELCQDMPNHANDCRDMPNENDNENVNANVNENLNEKERDILSPDSFSNINIPKDYAKQVFDILKDNNLPCCLGNYISFMQSDFKFALETLHSRADLRGLHSDMVLGALKNYAQVVNNPSTWQGWKNKKSFDRFVSWERFKDFLPDRFCLDNFLDRSTPPPTKAQNQTVGVNRALEILREVQNEQR